MDPLDLTQIAESIAAGHTLRPGLMCRGISIDTRTMQAGDLYFALQGEKYDGHDFVTEALKRKACGAVVRFDFLGTNPHLLRVPDTLAALQTLAASYRKRFDYPVVAITGSHGKTTTKDIAYAVFSKHIPTHGTHLNLNGLIGVPLTVMGMNTHHRTAIIEAGISRPGEMDILGPILSPTAVCLTCIADSHTEFLKDLEGIRTEKTKLFKYLTGSQLRVLNADDALIMQSYREGFTVTYGFESGDYRCLDYYMTPDRSEFRVSDPSSTASIRYGLPLTGRHNISNALAVIALARHSGVSPELIQAGFDEAVISPHRSRIIRVNGITLIDDSYNAAPLSMIRSLEMLRELAGPNRCIAVLGDMLELGDESVRAHRNIGYLVSELQIDLFLCYGPLMKEAADAALSSGIRALYCDSTEQVTDALLAILRSSDTVLIKSSHGMKSHAIVASVLDKFQSE